MHCSAKQSSRIFSASHTCVFVSKETCCCSRFNQKCLEFSIFSPWRNYFELDLDPTLEILLSKDYFLISRFLLVVCFIFLYFTFTIESTRHKSTEEGFAIPMTKRKLTFIDEEKTRRPFFHSRTNTVFSRKRVDRHWTCQSQGGAEEQFNPNHDSLVEKCADSTGPISQWNPRLTTITSHDRFHRFIRLESFCNKVSLKRYNLLSSNVQNDHFTKVCKYSYECTRTKRDGGGGGGMYRIESNSRFEIWIHKKMKSYAIVSSLRYNRSVKR